MFQSESWRGRSIRLSAVLTWLAATGCYGAINGPIRPDAPEDAITVVNSHPRNIRVSLITETGKPYYLGTVDAGSRRVLAVPAGYRGMTVHLLLVAQSRSYRNPPEGAYRVTSTQRPLGAATQYTIEQVPLAQGGRLELRIGAFLNQSRVVMKDSAPVRNRV